MPLLIGITGKARSGKDTLANLLFTEHQFLPMAFAIPLKNAVAEAYGVCVTNLHTQEGKATMNELWAATNRTLLQEFGEMLCQQHGADFWVRRWLIDFCRFRDTDDVVVSDVRKDVEAEYIRQLGGVVVHLERDGAGLAGKEAQHVSERGVELARGDVVIRNNGTIQDLRAHALSLVTYARESKRAA